MDVKKQITSNTKKIAINHYLNNNITQNEIANIFKIDVRTVKRWIRRFRDDALERKKITTKSYKIKQKHDKLLLNLLKKQPRLSVDMYWKEIYKI